MCTLTRVRVGGRRKAGNESEKEREREKWERRGEKRIEEDKK